MNQDSAGFPDKTRNVCHTSFHLSRQANRMLRCPYFHCAAALCRGPAQFPRFKLGQNFPNPFNPSTAIGYELPSGSYVTLKIYDVLGREVATLVNEQKKPGTYMVNWNAERMASGVYFYRLQASQTDGVQPASSTETRKLVLVR